MNLCFDCTDLVAIYENLTVGALQLWIPIVINNSHSLVDILDIDVCMNTKGPHHNHLDWFSDSCLKSSM